MSNLKIEDGKQEVKAEDVKVGDSIKFDGTIWTVLGFTPMTNTDEPYVYFSSSRTTKTTYKARILGLGVFTMFDLRKMTISPAELVAERGF